MKRSFDLDDIYFSYVPKNVKANRGTKTDSSLLAYGDFVNRLANRDINVNDGVYDYKSFYNANPNLAMRIANGDNSVHFPDTYKTPLHPTFSTDSKYSNDKTEGGTWYKTNAGWVFNHSPFTAKHLDETDDYLGENARKGVYEMSRLGNTFRLPTVIVTPKRKVK